MFWVIKVLLGSFKFEHLFMIVLLTFQGKWFKLKNDLNIIVPLSLSYKFSSFSYDLKLRNIMFMIFIGFRFCLISYSC